ncbi:MAG: low molecular weight phosphotyrosine protein phosphatase [Gammaproteobacteria bacterium]|nr:MAG: low molecular weight phosphotyrosine protein phosphatase [Gammaproteobacteria bacterium]
MKHRVLFVCMGNICRSPTAEAVLSELLRRESAGLEVEVDSAGTHAYHLGAAPDERAMAAARRRGIEMSSLRARLIELGDFERFDLVLAMDQGNYEHLLGMAPPQFHARIRLFLDFAPALGRREVPDPYYGGPTGFEDVLDLVETGARGLLSALAQSRGPKCCSSPGDDDQTV